MVKYERGQQEDLDTQPPPLPYPDYPTNGQPNDGQPNDGYSPGGQPNDGYPAGGQPNDGYQPALEHSDSNTCWQYLPVETYQAEETSGWLTSVLQFFAPSTVIALSYDEIYGEANGETFSRTLSEQLLDFEIELTYTTTQLEAYIVKLYATDALIAYYEALLATVLGQIEALGGFQPIQPFLTSLLPCGARAWWTVNAPPHHFVPFPFYNEVDWQPLSPDQELRWPVIPGFSVGNIDGRANLWGAPGTPTGVVFHHTPHLNISACGRFYESNMFVVFWTQTPPHMVAHATLVQLGLQNLHLNFDNGVFPLSYSPTNLPPPTTFDTNAVVGEYFQSDFEWDAEIVNETRAADGNPFSAALNLDIAPLRLVLPEGGAFEFVGPNPYIYETDRIWGEWQGTHTPPRLYDPYQHIRNIQIRPKEGLPAGTHQAYVYIYQWGDIPIFCTRRGGYFYDVWLGFIPEFGTGRTFTNANNGRFSVTFVVDPAPITIEKWAEYETRYHTNDPSIEGVLVHDYITYTLRIINEDPLFPWPAGEVAGDNIDARFAEFVLGSVRIGNTPDPTGVVAYTADRIQPIGGYPFYAFRVELPELPPYGEATYITFQVRTKLEAAGNEMYVDADIFGDRWGGAVRTGIPNIAFINIMCRDNPGVVIDTNYSNEVFVPVLVPIPIIMEKWAQVSGVYVGYSYPEILDETWVNGVQVGEMVRYTIRVHNPCLLTVREGLVLTDRINLDNVIWFGNVSVVTKNAAGDIVAPAMFMFADYSINLEREDFGIFAPFSGLGGFYTEFRQSLPDIPPGWSIYVSFDVQVRPEAVNAALRYILDPAVEMPVIPNRAWIPSSLPNGETVYSNEWVIPVLGTPLPSITKASGYIDETSGDFVAVPNHSVMVGDTFTYALTVINPDAEIPIAAGLVVGDNLRFDLVSWVNSSLRVYISADGGNTWTQNPNYSYTIGLNGQLRVTMPQIPAGGQARIVFDVVALAAAAGNELLDDGDVSFSPPRYGVRNRAFIVGGNEDGTNRYSNPVDVLVTTTITHSVLFTATPFGPGGTVNGVQNYTRTGITPGSPVGVPATPMPDPGWHFVNWTHNGNPITEAEIAAMLVTNSDLVFVANFAQIPVGVPTITKRAGVYVPNEPPTGYSFEEVTQATVGDTVTYTLTVYNPNAETLNRPFTIRDPLPSYLTFVNNTISIVDEQGNAFAWIVDYMAGINNNVLTIVLNRLPAGITTITFDVVVNALPPANAGELHIAHNPVRLYDNIAEPPISTDYAEFEVVTTPRPTIEKIAQRYNDQLPIQYGPWETIPQEETTPYSPPDYPVSVGDRIRYMLEIGNPNPTTAIPAGTVVGDDLNFDLVSWINSSLRVYISADGGNTWTQNTNFTYTIGLNGQLRVTLPELAPNAIARIFFEVTALAPAAVNSLEDVNYVHMYYGVRNRAFIVDGDETTPSGNLYSDQVDVVVTETPQTTLTITKVADQDEVYVGDTIEYTIVVTNTGDETAYNVVITDVLPAGVTYVSSSVDVTGVNTTFSSATRTVTAAVGDMLEGDIVTLTVTVIVNSTVSDGELIENIARAGGDNTNTPTAEEEVPVVEPAEATPLDPTITKAVGTSSAPVGTTVTNPNASALTDIRVMDNLPSYLTFVAGSVRVNNSVWANYAFTNGVLYVYFDSLAPGATTVTFQTTIASRPANGQIVNVAYLQGFDVLGGLVWFAIADDDIDLTVPTTPTTTTPGGGGGGGTPPPEPPVEIPDEDVPLGEMSPHHYAYIIGYPDGYVRPANNITRAEVATIFFRLISDEHRINIWSQTNPFPDVILQNWFNNAISTLTNANLLYGYPDGYFRPNQSMTRAEFSALIVRIMGHRGAMTTATNSFTDVSGHWGEAYISVAYELGWVRGYGDGTFRPDRFISRAEVAALVNRALNRLPENCDDLLEGMVTWPDNMNPNAWYYLYIQEATNSHYHRMKADGIHETWTELIEPREWWRLERPNSDPNIFTGAYIGQGMGMDR